MINFKLPEDLYIKTYVEITKRQKLSLLFILTTILILIGIISGLIILKQYVGAIIILILIIFFETSWIKGPKWTAKKNYERSSLLHDPISIAFKKNEILVKSGDSQYELNLDGFCRIEETSDIYYIEHQNGISLYIPKDILTDDEKNIILNLVI